MIATVAALCYSCNATVARCFCRWSFVATVAGHCCSSNATVAVCFCCCRNILAHRCSCNGIVGMQPLQCVSTAAASLQLLQVIAAVAVQPLQCYSAAADSLQLLQLIAAFAMHPLQCVSAVAERFQLFQLIAAVAMKLYSCSFIATVAAQRPNSFVQLPLYSYNNGHRIIRNVYL